MNADRHLSAVPAPDRLSAADRFYEWLLSDHPAAVHERARRHMDNRLHEAEDRAGLRAFVTRTQNDPAAPAPVRRLADTAERLISQSLKRDRDYAAANTPERIAKDRQVWENHQRATGTDPDYTYPARYQGATAACQPLVADPGHRAYDLEAHASLGQRAADALAVDNHSWSWVRQHAVTDRGRDAQPTRPRPASTRDGRGEGRGRG